MIRTYSLSERLSITFSAPNPEHISENARESVFSELYGKAGH